MFDLSFLQIATLNSFQSNDDGEGFISFDDGNKEVNTFKSTHKLAIIRKPERYLNKTFVAFHERYKTHGDVSTDNTQPVETENVFVFHNGIMNVTNKSEKLDENVKDSDSVIFAKRLNKRIMNGATLPESFKALIPKIEGSKSLLMFDRTTFKLYYYKNSGTVFYCVKNKEIAFLSTNKENCDVASLFYHGLKETTIKDGVLYEIEINGNFKKVFKIKDDYSKLYSGTFKKFSRVNLYGEVINNTQKDTSEDLGSVLSIDKQGNLIRKETITADSLKEDDYNKYSWAGY